MIDFKGHRIEKAIILICIRWYLAYPLSYRNLEEMMAERGVTIDHSNIYRWIQKFTPKLEAAFRKSKKHSVGKSWRMDEMVIKIKGQWMYLYRTVDKEGQTIDFLLTAHRNKKAALRFLKKAVRQHGLSDKVAIDKSGANTAALETFQEETGHKIEIRQSKYLSNRIEQDHRAIKRIVRPMLAFKTFASARCTLRGIELMHMIKKGQMLMIDGQSLSTAEQFYALAA
ncbi:IS6 family transposase [Methylobacter luteus]|jgi:putative transposase|uniref:IS6 family transposase n=1 Tax=Methylobacter luteus TaxID=415 RepID=UPI000419361B|nr:IS6 family transposase [Methylobacter luteus]